MEPTDTHRVESDSMGEVHVAHDRYWGAQTERSLHHFSVADDRMPGAVIRSMAVLKKAAALVNRDLGKMSEEVCKPIGPRCDVCSIERFCAKAGVKTKKKGKE